MREHVRVSHKVPGGCPYHGGLKALWRCPGKTEWKRWEGCEQRRISLNPEPGIVTEKATSREHKDSRSMVCFISISGLLMAYGLVCPLKDGYSISRW